MNKSLLRNQMFAIFFSMLPVLLVSRTFERGLISAGILLGVSVITTVVAYLLKDWIKGTYRVYAYILLVAAQMTIIGLSLKIALSSGLENAGLFLSLFIVNVVIIGYAELVADKVISIRKNFLIVLQSALLIVLISLAREILSTGAITFVNLFEYRVKLFNEKYALTLFGDISGGLIITGIVAAIAFAILTKGGKEE